LRDSYGNEMTNVVLRAAVNPAIPRLRRGRPNWCRPAPTSGSADPELHFPATQGDVPSYAFGNNGVLKIPVRAKRRRLRVRDRFGGPSP
jgi:hypothetical protein